MNVQNHCTPGHGTLPFQPYQTWPAYATVRVPHKCPSCEGRGFVDAGFYSATGQTWGATSTTPETCRSCDGTGIVWEVRQEYAPVYQSGSITVLPGSYQTYQSTGAAGTLP